MPNELIFSQYINPSSEMFMLIAKDGMYTYNDWIKNGTSWRTFNYGVMTGDRYKFKLILKY